MIVSRLRNALRSVWTRAIHAKIESGGPGLKAWPVLGISIIQGVLLFGHWLIYCTLVLFLGIGSGSTAVLILRAAMLPLAFSFIAASLIGHSFNNWLVSAFYRLAAIWLGFVSFLFFAACLCWLTLLGFMFTAGAHAAQHVRPTIAVSFYGVALVAGFYGLINARLIRTRRVAVTLPNLPASWHGRTALLLSDLHLGHVNQAAFSQRIAALVERLQPDVILIAGDVFDGSKVNAGRVLAPFTQLAPRFGTYFSTGNHDEFGDTAGYLAALKAAGITILSNQKVTLDGLQILGVPYHDTTQPIRMRATLQAMRPDPASASILLSHVPNRLPIVEEAGISLQLSGHTHGGQFIPFTWLTRRIFGQFTYGLHAFGALQVYTSYGAGTWGPPMRLGTSPEVVLLTFA
jgi:predicted MPP superfamily phosphohydrolase